MEESKKNYGVVVGAVVLILIIASYGVFKYIKRDNGAQALVETPVDVNTDVTIQPVIVPEKPISGTYKDGTYSSVGNYFSPGGEESIAVSLTLKNDVVTSADVVSQAFRPESKMFQAKFISGYKTLVIGKKIDTIVLDKVSGSSLTPKGFNDALTEIKAQAKA